MASSELWDIFGIKSNITVYLAYLRIFKIKFLL